MRKRRFFISLVILIGVVSAFLLPVSAHPGKTDANGGHKDHSTGEYHYHHGFEEHQHYDINGDNLPDCPFEYEDRTDHSAKESPKSKKSDTHKSSTSNKTTSAKENSLSVKDQTAEQVETNPIIDFLSDLPISVILYFFYALIASTICIVSYMRDDSKSSSRGDPGCLTLILQLTSYPVFIFMMAVLMIITALYEKICMIRDYYRRR